MIVDIHRGADVIGGTCVEVCSGGTRLVLDVGMPLMHPGGAVFDQEALRGKSGPELLEMGVLPAVEGLYAWQAPSVDGVLVSHAHMDHYGLLEHVHPDIPVWMGRGTEKLIELTAFYTNRENPLKRTERFNWPHSFEVGAFMVTPHLVDHSSFGAFAFEIAAEGKRLFYSGDFREHGFLGKAMDILYAKVAPGVDALLMEGTMLGRAAGRVRTEEELSQEAAEICKGTDKAVLVYQSGQNVTRAVAFYKAAVRSGRWFIPDVYMADVLAGLGECPGGGSLPWPGKPGFDKARVWYPGKLTHRLFEQGRGDIPLRYVGRKMERADMTAHPEKVMLFVRPGMEGDIAAIPGLHGGTLLYSLWEGYLESDRTAAFLKSMEALGITVKNLHTSGHADIPALQRMTERLQPKKILPIHTLHPRDYAGLFNFPVEIKEDDRYTL